MARIIKTGKTPAKQRHLHRRSCAEALHLLAKSSVFGAEERDLASFIVTNLRGIYKTIESSANSWDDRGYWKKAEDLRQRWHWTRTTADELEALILSESWNEIPPLLVSLVSRFDDITVRNITRNGDWWCGAHRALHKQASN